MRRLALAVIAAAAFVAPPAMAEQQKPGWYGSVAGSWRGQRDYDGSGSFAEVKTKNGHGFALGAGCRYANGFRAEAELAYGNVEIDRVTRDDAGSTKVGGDFDMYSLTGAVYID